MANNVFQASVTSISESGKDSVTGLPYVVLTFTPINSAFFGNDPATGIFQIRVTLATAQLVQISQVVTFTLT